MSEFSVTAIRIRIFLSVVVALLLTTMPLPELVSPYRPLFVPLVILFWSIFFPLRFTLFMALLAGLALEASQTLVFGQTALGLIVISVFALSNHRRIQLAALPQQLLTVAALLFVYQFLQIWIESLLDRPTEYSVRFIAVIFSMIFWPGVIVFMHKVILRKKHQAK